MANRNSAWPFVAAEETSLAYDVACRPTALPVRAPIPSGWKLWSHGEEQSVFKAILGVESPPAVVLIERCCEGREACATCDEDEEQAS
ncbi:MAG: hypothetical protein U0821_16755 [Chloroflexota bacterium]